MTTGEQSEHAQGYEPFFGLHEAPFSLAPDPRFLFTSASHSAALAQVAYALERREPLVVITGDIGTGKTLLCRTVLQRLRRKTFLSVINDPLLERDDLLKQLLQDFGVVSRDRTKLTETTRHELVETLHAFLRSLSPIQAHAVVIIDEAQHLQPEVLEQIRLISNIDDERGTLLQIILVGQSDLEPLLSRPELRQLQQRVSRRFSLEPLNADEVGQYIQHRLALARDGQPPSHAPGATELAQELAEWDGTKPGVEFTADAVHAVSEFSGGVPRVINLLCDRSLEEASAAGLRIIDRPLIETAADALGVGAHASPKAAADPPVTAGDMDIGPDASIWALTRSELVREDEIIQRAGESTRFSGQTETAAASRVARYLVLAAVVALIGVAIWFGVRRAQSRPTEAPASAVAPRASVAPAAPTTPQAAPPSTAVGATPGRESFDIVVASFRTDARAASVATEVAAIGLPIRRRVSDGWQQVVSGPFASRPDAENAQQRLDRAGFTDTRVVPTAP